MFGFDSDYPMMDVTPVENYFISEFMADAKGDYIKVYLYGLMHSYHPTQSMSLTQMAHDLAMSEKDIEAAFRYWERRHLVARIQDHPPEYRFANAKQQLMRRENETEDERAYQRFAEGLYAAFGDRRRLDGKECALAYEWVEDLGLSPEVVLMLVNQLILTRGPQFSFRVAQKDALALVDEGVTTIEDAERVLSRSRAVFDGTKDVLRRLGRRHSPSEDEMALYRKWLYSWNFTPDAILEACRETTKGTPSMAYLDGILQGLFRRNGETGIRSKAEMDKRISDEQTRYDGVRKLLSVLGAGATRPTDALNALYQEMLALLPEDALIKIAQQTARYGGRMVEWEQTVRYLSAHGVNDLQQVNAYYARHYALMQQTCLLLEKMGLPPRADMRQMAAVRGLVDHGASEDALLEAAQLSAGKRDPFSYFCKVAQGGQTPVSVPASGQGAPSKGRLTREQNYTQRAYTDEELSSFARELWKEAQGDENEE